MGPEEESVHINFYHLILSGGFVLLWIQSLRQTEIHYLATQQLHFLCSCHNLKPIFLIIQRIMIPFEKLQQREKIVQQFDTDG